jgi:phosphatidylglycerol---prolipoprotein diacylglyceryl transferase
MGVLALGYAVPRFFLDFLRARDLPFVDGRILGLTPAQWLTPVLAVVGIRLILSGVRIPVGSAPPAARRPTGTGTST